ncbi:Uma2 family endonuclease [Streptomyces sp. NBC_00454]|uniref:Uma2 family endonuclease n=1 Tax=Streptomyces sp. NBC_00454 TaxID=2975747 RepID=UPI0030E49C77
MGAFMDPPPGGWTADDLDTLPNLPPHTELIDGNLVLPSPQTLFHTRSVSLLERLLESLAPPDLAVLSRFTIDIDRHNRPEPDVLVVHEHAIQGWDQTRLPAEDVVLAVEVVMAESLTRDSEIKPVKYAGAGIPHYWRVEGEEGQVVVSVFEREPATGAYAGTGIFHDRVKVSVPFPMDLDLTSITRRRRKPD